MRFFLEPTYRLRAPEKIRYIRHVYLRLMIEEIYQLEHLVYPGDVIGSTLKITRQNDNHYIIEIETRRVYGRNAYSELYRFNIMSEGSLNISVKTMLFTAEERAESKGNMVATDIDSAVFSLL